MTPETFGLRPDVALWSDEKAALTALIVAALLALRWALIRMIRRRSGDGEMSEGQHRALAWVRNGGLLVVFGVIFALWLPEIEAFALSITAFVVAVVIATKELIMCLAGAALRTTSGAFRSGDWIEVQGRSGEVADQTLLSTTLWEFDETRQEYTGRQVTLPNSVFLAAPVVNHGFRRRFVFHEFTIFSEPIPTVEAARDAIQAGLEAAATDFAPIAARYAATVEKRSGIRLPPGAPRVRVWTTEFAKLAFEATVFCPRERALEMETAGQTAFQEWVARQDWRFAGTVPKG